ncbi:hypothetical protein QFZ79_004083 [Arthrobacter sp. V4I6]|uniref:DUF4192 family protein n=1 Tax=unclassified Arthrobacter TaxID=235627 RepID=UPI002780E439|nr:MULTISPECIES: DUF4192 family protein [unclassified Arthrobacter]MDQ0821707.1 hypothetical protein [Arthrobacter sp. V1I7]MDQ0855972.1 hypothetical protein [Arthrobacter sp. V4I6]
MTAPDHLKITGPEDVLGFIPHSLGYWPSRSLVAMTMQGKRLGATLRVDLPADGSPGGFAGFASTVAGYLEADDEADGVLLAFFTGSDATVTGGAGAPWAELLEELERALAECGMPVRDAWLIGAEHWRNAYCTDPSCCAPPGRPVDEIRNSKLNAEMVFRGSTVGPAPGAEAPGPFALPEDPAVLESERNWFRLFSGHTRDRLQFAQVLDVWDVVLRSPAGPPLPVGLAGYLRAALRVPAWRDAVLVMAAAGPEAAEQGAADFGMFDPSGPRSGPAAGAPAVHPGTVPGALAALRSVPEARSAAGRQAPPPPAPVPLPPLDGFGPLLPRGGSASGAWDGSPEVPGYGDVLLGLAPSVPDWPRMASLERVLVQLGEAGGDAAAAALTGRGWIEWCRGKGSFADALFSRAEAEHPGYRLAALLAELVGRGTLCGWAARRNAAWQKFEPGAA